MVKALVGGLAQGNKTGVQLIRGCLMLLLCAVLLFTFVPMNAMASGSSPAEDTAYLDVGVTVDTILEGTALSGETVVYTVNWTVEMEGKYTFSYTLDKDATVNSAYLIDEDVEVIPISEGNQTVTWTFDSDSGSEKAKVQVYCTISGQPEGHSIENRLYVTNNIGADPIELFQTTNIKYSINKVAHDKADAWVAGNKIPFEITWYNWTGKEAEKVVIEDKLDPGLDYIPEEKADYENDGGFFEYVEETRTLRWTFTNVESGKGGNITFNLRLNATGTHGIVPKNKATIDIGGETLESETAPQVDLEAPKKTRTSDENVRVGDRVEFDITGWVIDEEYCRIVDTLDYRLTFESSSVDNELIETKEPKLLDDGSTELMWILDDLDLGDSFKIHVVATVNENASVGDTIKNIAHQGYGFDGEIPYGYGKDSNEEKVHVIRDPDVVDPKVEDHTLTISKKVTGTDEDLTQFNFTITVDDPTISGDYGVMFNQGKAKFALRDGDYIEIKGLPVDTKYTIVEAPADDYTTTVMVDGESSTGRTASGVIDSDGGTVRFENCHVIGVGDLMVSNRITGAGADPTKRFHYTVQFDDPSVAGMYRSLRFNNGYTEFTLSDGEYWIFEDLPDGVGYTVTEQDANQYGYTTTSTAAEGHIEAGGVARASFVNDKPAKPTKELVNVADGDSVSPGDDLTYRISWYNDRGAAANVVITDTLDPNVEYVRSSDGGVYNPRTHSVSWYLRDQPAAQTGSVTVEVQVAESALRQGEVTNQAVVQVGNASAQWTELVEVPVGEKPHKTLLYPDSGTAVTVGDQIGYSISWFNPKRDGSRVVITDVLDKGVDFVSASNGGTYNPTTRTVTWTLNPRLTEANGSVTLVVAVNAQAEKQHTVTNQAEVRVGTGTTQETEEVEVPVGEKPHKSLMYPETGKAAAVGEEIGYSITWYNGREDSARVVITDPLDDGVTFVRADSGGIYDAKTHTVTWTLQNRQPGTSGKVSLVVAVNEKALEAHLVTNQADVRVGTDPSQKTEVVSVQVGDGPHKKLLYPEQDTIVPEGGEISYSISWYNNRGDGAKITITDPLDEGVDFVSASNGGNYNPDTHTVTWMLDQQKTGASGDVTLTVQVNEKALLQGSVLNQATVQVNGETAVETETVTVRTDTEEPHKKLISPAEGTSVQVGTDVTYQINWCNVNGTAAVIEDHLDNGVDFVSAAGGVYDAAAHAVTWNINAQTPGTVNTLTITVRVNSFAAAIGKVDNQALVYAGDTVKKTETVTVSVEKINQPVQPVKEEIEPGEGLAVEIGEMISYNITWKNPSNTDAAVIVRDTLESDVEYVSASSGGVYDPSTRTVTWTIAGQKADTEGSVSLVVRVAASAAASGKVANHATVQVGATPSQSTNTVENPLKTGSLTVSKSVAGNTGEADRAWSFIITLDNSAVNGKYGGVTFEHGQAHFSLKHGEKVQINGIPAGLSYTITEVEANQDEYRMCSRNANGVIVADKDIPVTFINSRGAEAETNTTGSMAVRKLVTGDLGDPNREFHFKVVLSDTGLSGWYGDMEFKNGVAQFTLRSGEHLWARYLPVGTSYTVTETEANQEGYRAIISGNEGVIYGISRLEARFQNHKGDWLPEYDEPWEDLPDPDVPLADIPDYPEQQDIPPATGDQWVIVLWIALMAASALGLTAILTGKRKEK